MGDQFEDAYERFHEKIQAAHKHLNVNKLKNAQKSLNDCGKQIKNMEREARHSDGVERRRLLEKIKQSKAMLQKTKQEYQQIADKPEKEALQILFGDYQRTKGSIPETC